MHLTCDLFHWSRWCTSVIPNISPDGGWPGFHLKPLGAVIWQVFTLYRPGGQRGHMQKKNYKKVPYLPAVFLVMTVRWYNTKHILWRRGSKTTTEATGCHLWAIIAGNSTQSDKIYRFFFKYFHHPATFQWVEMTSRPLISIEVWHMKLTGRTSLI